MTERPQKAPSAPETSHAILALQEQLLLKEHFLRETERRWKELQDEQESAQEGIRQTKAAIADIWSAIQRLGGGRPYEGPDLHWQVMQRVAAAKGQPQ